MIFIQRLSFKSSYAFLKRHQWHHTVSIGTQGINVDEIWNIIKDISFNKINPKMLSANWWPFCSDLIVLNCVELDTAGSLKQMTLARNWWLGTTGCQACLWPVWRSCMGHTGMWNSLVTSFWSHAEIKENLLISVDYKVLRGSRKQYSPEDASSFTRGAHEIDL